RAGPHRCGPARRVASRYWQVWVMVSQWVPVGHDAVTAPPAGGVSADSGMTAANSRVSANLRRREPMTNSFRGKVMTGGTSRWPGERGGWPTSAVPDRDLGPGQGFCQGDSNLARGLCQADKKDRLRAC